MNWIDCKIDRFIRWVRDNPRFLSDYVGPPAAPMYRRWVLIPKNPLFNMYLHNFVRSDPQSLHDHRMANITIVLQGWGYVEERYWRKPVAGQPFSYTSFFEVHRFWPRFRLPSTPHRVILPDGNPVWSLFIGLPHVRNWGFWREYGGVACWFPHQALVKSNPETGASIPREVI